MARMVIELTNRCNLRCHHCFEERHAATGELPLAIIEQVLQEGNGCGIDHLAFTGGEPTLHRQFAEIVERVCQAAYTYSLVSNGMTFPQIAPLLWRSQPWFKGVTFSLDGACEATHDRLRGHGSFRGVMRATSVCVMKDLPFTLNMVLTSHNRHEVAEMVDLAGRLGGAGVRFGWLMPTPETALHGLDLPPQERHEVEAEIRRLQQEASVAVGMAPGYFSPSPFFPCAPLTLKEYNLDYRGNLTLCCQLSGYAGGAPGTDVVGNLHNLSLVEAVDGFHRRVATYLADKRAKVSRGELGALDHFPCWYCVQYLDKVPGLTRVPHHPWAHALAAMPEGTSDGELGSPGATTPRGGRYGVGGRGNGAPAAGEQNLL
jgi:MoaA/NifB/PqqE/SkfB family radical SAM enzyme